MKFNLKFLLAVLLLFGFTISNAQESDHFKDEVDKLYNQEYNFSPDKKLVVFAGSSSIRMWKDVADYFPQFNVINNGFGGSQFSDLLYFYNQLITKQKPDYLFVYEGDNDLAGDKKISEVYKDFKTFIKKVKVDLPATKVIFISPKPSIARWNLKKKYEKFNKKMNRYCDKKKDNIEFADVWDPMLDSKGVVFQDIFLNDGLHMKKKGYDIWEKVLLPYLK